LIRAGYDSAIDGEAYTSIFFQNANHSVRVTDDFIVPVEQILSGGRERKIVSDTHGVIGVLEKDRGIGFAIDCRVVAGANQSVRFGSSLYLHSMNSTISGWSTFRMTILAARRVLPRS